MPLTQFRLDEHFRKDERLQKRSQFKRAERRGRRVSSRHLVVYGAKNDLDWSRVGITVTRKVGIANQRNRWKRRIREIFRRNKREFPGGYDFVVIVKHTAPADPDFTTLRDEMIALLNEAATARR